MTVSWVEIWLANWAPGLGTYGMKFNWQPATSSISHVILRSILFNVCINNLADGMACTLSQNEDDAKLGQVACTLKGRDQGHSGGPGQAGKTG